MKSFKLSAYIIGGAITLTGVYIVAFTPETIVGLIAIFASIIFISAFYKFTNL